MNSVNVIWKSNNTDSNIGYLRLSSRIGNKTVTKSLGLDPIHKRFFDKKHGTVKPAHPESEFYNNFILQKRKEVERKGNKIRLVNDEKKSFIDFVNKIIARTINPGTKQKYTNIRNLLQLFNEEVYGDKDIKFSEITVDYIEKFKSWLRTTRKNQLNSTSNKIKAFQSFVNKATKEKAYTYDVNPFLLVKKPIEDTVIDILTKEDLDKLIKTPLREVYRAKIRFGQIITDKKVLKDDRYKHRNQLNDIRCFFLFQLFSQGLRVSDLMTLRWNNFYVVGNDIRMKKRMIKTKAFIDILLNYNTLGYLLKYVPSESLPEPLLLKLIRVSSGQINVKLNYSKSAKNSIDESEVIIPINAEYVIKYGWTFPLVENKYKVTINSIDDEIRRRNRVIKYEITSADVVEFDRILEETRKTDPVLLYLNRLSNIIRSIITSKQANYKLGKNNVLNENYKVFSEVIEFLSINKETKNLFCFPILRNEDFSDIEADNDFGRMTELQYTKFTGGRTYYNRLLKVIAVQCEINKPLRTHLSRHSYTSLMLEIGENLNLFDLMTSLGHKHLNTTQKYIQKFNNKRVDILNKQLADYISKRDI